MVVTVSLKTMESLTFRQYTHFEIDWILDGILFQEIMRLFQTSSGAASPAICGLNTGEHSKFQKLDDHLRQRKVRGCQTMLCKFMGSWAKHNMKLLTLCSAAQCIIAHQLMVTRHALPQGLVIQGPPYILARHVMALFKKIFSQNKGLGVVNVYI